MCKSRLRAGVGLMKSREKLYRKCERLSGPAADQMSADDPQAVTPRGPGTVLTAPFWGTRNYSRAVSAFATAIALVRRALG